MLSAFKLAHTKTFSVSCVGLLDAQINFHDMGTGVLNPHITELPAGL
jgi:hypothetical protein